MSKENENDGVLPGPSNDQPPTPSMEEAIAAIHEQREAVDHIKATKTKLYGLLQRDDLDESTLGPTLLELDDNFRSLHSDAIRNEDARRKFNEQVESVLHKGMEIMHIFNPEFNTLKDLEPYRQQWYEDDQRRKWAELLHPKRQRQGSKPGKGQGQRKKLQITRAKTWPTHGR